MVSQCYEHMFHLFQWKAAASTIVCDEPVEAVQATLGMFMALAMEGVSSKSCWK